jgi:hypothetical protein
MFPFPCRRVENRYYTLTEAKDGNDNSLGAFINGIHMEVDSDVFEMN